MNAPTLRSVLALLFGFAAGCGQPALAPVGPWTPPTVQPRAYLVVAADPLVAAAMEFAAYRGADAGTVTGVKKVSDLVAADATAEQLAAAVRAALLELKKSAPAGAPAFILLLGDAPGPSETTAGQIPALPCQNVLAGCHTDNLYADLDGDGLPDAAVGRVPARTVAAAQDYLAKLKQHETRYETGEWNRRLSLYTGQANFSPQLDTIIETGVMMGLKNISHAFDVVGVYDNPASPYYYQPFDTKAFELFEGGALAVVYVGHGSSDWTEGLTIDQVAAMSCAHRLPIAVFFACTNGRYVGPIDSITEALLWQKQGPVATIGAEDESHPYANAILAYEFMRALLDARPATFGEAFQLAKRAIVSHDDEFRRWIDTVGRAVVPTDEQATLRAQQVNLYNLFGDPAAALNLPGSNAILDPLPPGALVEGRLAISGKAPRLGSGVAVVTLEAERDVLLQPLAPVDPAHPDTATVQSNWAKAVNKVVSSATVPINRDGSFAATLAWTPPLPGGDYYVKVYATDGANDSFGFSVVP